MYSGIITSKIAKKSLAAEYDDVVNPLIQRWPKKYDIGKNRIFIVTFFTFSYPRNTNIIIPQSITNAKSITK